ncbi:MAG: ribonuclease Z, partial [Saprospiraceae bacterium]
AFPVFGRHPSCQILNHNDNLIMIDCGEGTQIQIGAHKIRKSKISHIFISHLHGDHCYGLPGLLTSYALQGRNKEMHLHGPIGIKAFIKAVFTASFVNLPYLLSINEYDADQSTKITIGKHMAVTLFPLQHRVPTIGFRFDEVNISFNIIPEMITKHQLSVDEIKNAKLGIDINRKNETLPYSSLTYSKEKAKSYCYCSDTVYDPSIIKYIENSSLLYHETTYLDDLEHLAKERMHSTLGQAIKIAKAANIPRMITGHYSSRYNDVSIFATQGKTLFDGLLIGEEGKNYSI